MDKISAEYTITLGDYRQATYYALVIRNRIAFRIALGALAFGLIYLLTVAIGITVLHPIILFVAAAYLIWVLIILGQEEIRIRSYVRSKDCLIGHKNTFFMEGNRIRIQIPDKNITANLTINRLAVAFEISALFLLYTTAQQVYLVPKRAFTEDQLRKIRSTLAKQIPGRFSTRF